MNKQSVIDQKITRCESLLTIISAVEGKSVLSKCLLGNKWKWNIKNGNW